MLKAVARAGDKDVLVLGFSAENLRRLAAGQPIIIKKGELGGLEIEVLIFAAATERALLGQFEALIGPQTKVSIDPRTSDA